MTSEEIIEQQNAYYMAGYPSRRSENQKPTYEELEKENLYYKDVIETNTAEWEEQGRRVVELEKENEKLTIKVDEANANKSFITTKYNELLLLNTILNKENDELQKENVDLRNNYEDFKAIAEPEIRTLKEELKKWIDEWQEQVQKENDESYARTLQTIQLNKAKELIKNIIRVTWNEGWNYSLDWKVKAEDFLKEVE